MLALRFMIIASGLSLCATGCMVGSGGDGSTADDIIGGHIDYGDPSVVAIFAHQPGASQGSLCTGSVISPTAVLTAAHCVDPAVAGSGNVFEVYPGTNLGDSVPLAVESTVFDPAFDIENLTAGHDVAIVKLAMPTDLDPIPYGPLAWVGGRVRIVGYGMDTHLTNIPGIPSGVGTKRTANAKLNDANDLLLSIGNTNRQTCHGDSGGPALQWIDGEEVIVGVTSFGTDVPPNVVCIYGGVDTRLDNYLDFIDANL